MNTDSVGFFLSQILQKCLDKKNSPTVEFLVVDHVVASGINSRQDKVSVETMKLLPGLFLPDAIDETDFEPIIVALFTQLEKPSREQVKINWHLCFQRAVHESFAQSMNQKVKINWNYNLKYKSQPTTLLSQM